MPDSSGWTIDTLEKHLTDKIEALDRFCVANFAQGKERVDMALAASDKAIGKAELATEKRFEGVNEFRSTLADQAANLMPRLEYTVQHRALEEKVELITKQLNDTIASMRGRKEGVGNVGVVVIGASVVLTGLGTAIGTAILFITLHH